MPSCAFHGSFVLEPSGTSTRVTHREEFSFRAPLAWVMEPVLRGWLTSVMEDEMTTLKGLLERDAEN
jgi:hypothetical protein